MTGVQTCALPIYKLKSRHPLFVSSYLKETDKREAGSGNYGNDYDDDQEEEEEEEIEPSQHFVPLLPTPTIYDVTMETTSTSTFSIQPTKSDFFIGSGDGALLQTPIVTFNNSFTKRKKKLQKHILNSGVKYQENIGNNCTNLKLKNYNDFNDIPSPYWIQFTSTG